MPILSANRFASSHREDAAPKKRGKEKIVPAKRGAARSAKQTALLRRTEVRLSKESKPQVLISGRPEPADGRELKTPQKHPGFCGVAYYG